MYIHRKKISKGEVLLKVLKEDGTETFMSHLGLQPTKHAYQPKNGYCKSWLAGGNPTYTITSKTGIEICYKRKFRGNRDDFYIFELWWLGKCLVRKRGYR